MPRQARVDAPGTLHHEMLRDIERARIVLEPRNRVGFVARLFGVLTSFIAKARGGVKRNKSTPSTTSPFSYVWFSIECSGAAVARFVGLTTPLVHRLAVSEDLPESKRHLKPL